MPLLSTISSRYDEFISALNSWKIPNDISFLICSTIYFIPFFHRKVVQNLEAIRIRGIFFKDLSIGEKLCLFEEITFPIIAKALTEMKIKSVIIELRVFVFQIKRPVSILAGLSYSIYGFGWTGYLLDCLKIE